MMLICKATNWPSPVRRLAPVFAVVLLAGCAAEKAPAPQKFVVYFVTGSAALTPEAQQVVATVATAARAHPPSKVMVEGHADGGTTNDAALAEQRARAVTSALEADGIVAAAIALLPGAPAADTAGVEAHQVVVQLIP